MGLSPERKLYYRNWLGFFLLGTINNLAYVVINTSAKSLVTHFNAQSLVGLIPWANVGAGFLFRAANTFLLTRVPFRWRVLFNVALLSGGLVMLICCYYVGFWFAILAIVLIGSSSSFGESVLLGYMKRYDSKVVGGWSSGTGLAGLFGSAYYLALSSAGLADQYTFVTLLPYGVVYLLVYALMLKETALPEAPANDADSSDEQRPLIQAPLIQEHSQPVSKVHESSARRVARCLKAVSFLALNLMLVYAFEYYVSVGGAAKWTHPTSFPTNSTCNATIATHALPLAFEAFGGNATAPPGPGGIEAWAVEHSFAVLAFCYQVGVMLSRSSLSCFKIGKVGITVVTVLQGINFVFWVLLDTYKFIPIVWIVFVLMVWVGLLGGLSYVSIFHYLLEDPSIREEDRELSVNLCALAINVGIVVASIFTIVVDSTFLECK